MTVAVAPALDVQPSDGFTGWEGLVALLRRAFSRMEGQIDPPSSLRRLDAGAGREGAGRAMFPRQRARAAGRLRVLRAAPRMPLHRKACGGADAAGARNRPPADRAGRGGGTALGLPALELQTRIERVENHAAFARMGFARIAETAHPGFERPTSITMRKDLQ